MAIKETYIDAFLDVLQKRTKGVRSKVAVVHLQVELKPAVTDVGDG